MGDPKNSLPPLLYSRDSLQVAHCVSQDFLRDFLPYSHLIKQSFSAISHNVSQIYKITETTRVRILARPRYILSGTAPLPDHRINHFSGSRLQIRAVSTIDRSVDSPVRFRRNEGVILAPMVSISTMIGLLVARVLAGIGLRVREMMRGVTG